MAFVGLISCVSQKLNCSTEARNLYNSPLFTKMRKYVEIRCEAWYILSAKYGLVDPKQIIEPYEETLNTKTKVERELWAQGVWEDLKHSLQAGDHVVILAGERYREYLIPCIVQHGCIIDVPMEGLAIGRQLQWLSKQVTQPKREHDLDRLYNALSVLEAGVGGRRSMSECTGKQNWPKSGIYIFFEPGERRSTVYQPRIVRVGTHGVSLTNKSNIYFT